MSESRTKNSVRNSFVGICSHLLSAVLSFVSRTVFIKILGVDYLGIGGLFSNILSMLALSDLGIYTVMTYSLYEPIAKNDTDRIAMLIQYFQRLYNIIALAILGIGMVLIPFLPWLVNGAKLPFSKLVLYYIILLLNSVVSYFAISKSTLFRADQKVFLVRLVTTASTIVMYIVQIVLLLVFHEYTIYLITQVIFTFGSNVVLSILASKKYPYLKNKIDKNISEKFHHEILKNLKASFLYKVGSKVMNSTDNILISVIVGTTMVGYYSNYVTIYSLVNTIVMIGIEAILASLGNYIATESADKRYKLFKILMLAMYGIAAMCVSCYLAGMNDFIRIWLGDEFVISGAFVLALAFNRFVFCSIHPLWMTRESSGVFISTQYVMISAAIINVVLSIILGKHYGITGVILATSLSYMLTVCWYEPLQLSKKVFNTSVKDYWRFVFKLIVACAPPILVGIFLLRLRTNTFALLCCKFVVCVMTSSISFFMIFRKSIEFQTLLQKGKSIVCKFESKQGEK